MDPQLAEIDCLKQRGAGEPISVEIAATGSVTQHRHYLPDPTDWAETHHAQPERKLIRSVSVAVYCVHTWWAMDSRLENLNQAVVVSFYGSKIL